MGLFKGRLAVKLGRDLGKDKAWSIAHAPIEKPVAHLSHLGKGENLEQVSTS